MPVIAFASHIVEAKHTTLIRDVRQPVLEGVPAIRKRFWKLPDHNLGLHVAYPSNTKMMLSTKATGVRNLASGKVFCERRGRSAGSSAPRIGGWAQGLNFSKAAP